MGRYLAGRLFWALVVLLAVAVATFILLYVIPHDPARTIAGIHASPDDVARIRAALGLDRSLFDQLVDYLARGFRGDLGYSYQLRTPVLPLLLERFPATAQLALGGLAVSLAIGVPLGVIAAQHRRGLLDRLASGTAILFVSIPSFWLAYLLLHFLAYQPAVSWGIDLFPLSGYEPFDLRYLALPSITLGLTGAAYYSRLTRSGMVGELSADYVRTAHSKGASPRRVTWRHAFRNALPPVITMVGLDLGFFLGGVVIIEQVFGWPGIGKLAADAIFRGDIPLVMGTVLFGTFTIVMANLVVDLVNAWVDPRIRH